MHQTAMEEGDFYISSRPANVTKNDIKVIQHELCRDPCKIRLGFTLPIAFALPDSGTPRQQSARIFGG